MIEKELEEQWGEAEEIVMISASATQPVIVLLEGKFCRGEIKMLWWGNSRLKANVFLPDYGSTIEIDVKKKARKLQLKAQLEEPPLAFKIILEGLYPISMDIDWMSGGEKLQESRKRSWDESALKMVQNVVKVCQGNGKLLEASTFPTRRVGSLVMMQPSPSSSPGPDKINLNNLLLERKFAGHSRLEAETDLTEVETDLGFGQESSSVSSEEEEEER